MLLESFRSASTSILAKALYTVMLVSAVIGLGMMDYNGMFRAGFHSDTVATVAGESVSIQQFDNVARRQLSKMHLEPKMALQMGYMDEILQGYINSELLSRATYDLGIQVNQDIVARLISKQLDEMIQNGQGKGLSKKDILQNALRNQGTTEAQFTQSMQSETANGLVMAALTKGAGDLPLVEVRDLYASMHEERTIKYVFLPDSAIKDYKDPDETILKPLYEKMKARFAIPETRSFSMLVLTGDSLKKTTDISEEELKKAYDESPTSYSTAEKRTLQQAVFKDEAAAKTVAEKVKKGASLKEASASAWLGELTTERKGLTADIAEPIFSAAKGDVVGPIQSPLGFHVFVVKDISSEKSLSFADAKEQIRKELLNTRISDELYKMSGQIDDKLAGGASLEDTAKDLGGKIEKFDTVHRDGSKADGKNAFDAFNDDKTAILKSAFDLSEGESSSVMQLKDGSYAAIRVDHINPTSYKPYESVKDDLKKTWIAQQQGILNNQKATAAYEALGSGKTSLEKIAQENHAEVRSVTMERMGEPKADFTDDAKKSFFDLAKGVAGFSAAKNGYVVGQTADIKLPDTGKLPADEIKAFAEGFKKTAQDQYLQSYTQWLRTQYKVSVNEQVLKQAYGGDNGDGQN
ncbi:MAG TPA: peptidyl-prolyl cis-trans isomerase [Patescibacteria group bacterium]|nr:peptidyl-prolyl cis-trans isomerase [Patescibacteria group bacterium]